MGELLRDTGARQRRFGPPPSAAEIRGTAVTAAAAGMWLADEESMPVRTSLAAFGPMRPR